VKYLLPLCMMTALTAAERINHAGRILGPVLTVSSVTDFHTSAGDSFMASLQIMPRDNPWNEDVSQLPLRTNSTALVTTIYNELAANRRELRIFYEMNYVLVPAAQPNQDMRLVDYPDESDAIKSGTTDIARYPFPNSLPAKPAGRPSTNINAMRTVMAVIAIALSSNHRAVYSGKPGKPTDDQRIRQCGRHRIAPSGT
jgi:hypothetical protein